MGKNAAASEAKRARQDEEARQGRIRQGTESINTTFDSQFNNDFFDRLSKGYTDFARPQLDDQFGKAREKLIYSLARNGTMDSSMRSEQFGDVDKEYNKNLLDITDKGREYATNARTGVENSRNDLISMLQATGDAQGAANAALSRASTLATPPAYSPLGQLFTDFTSGLAQQAAFERAEAYSGAPRGSVARYNTGLFTPSSGAVRVT